MHCRRIVHPLIPAATKKRLFVMRSVEVFRLTSVSMSRSRISNLFLVPPALLVQDKVMYVDEFDLL